MSHWSEQKERSNLFWLSALGFAATYFGRGFLRILCVPIALFFLLSAREARASSQAFLAKVLPHRPNWWHTFKHFYTFALVSSDRLLFLLGKWDRFNLDIVGDELIRSHDSQGKGCILLVSHIGSFDAMRVPAVEQKHIRLRILIDKQHNPAAMQVIEQLNHQLAADMIDASVPATTLALILNDALSDGEMVGIMADRSGLGDATHRLDFIDEQANFPTGPWMLSMTLKVPVILCFAIYEGGNCYRIRFHQISDGEPVERKHRQDRLQENMQQYASVLEQYAREHPFNWFNFYDFWTDESTLNK
jgi:predicted LPLAT superfamily acyltransferase